MARISCLPVSFYPDFQSGAMTIAGWAAMAERLGLDAIDLSVLITRRDKTRAGFPVDTIVTYTDFTHPDAACREREFERFKADVEDAVVLGAAYLRVTAGQAHPGTLREDGLDWAEDYLNRAAAFAQGSRVGLLFENHSKPGVWRHYDFAGDPDMYFEMLARLKDVKIDLLFDTANACFYRQDPVRMLERILPRVRRIHVADILDVETFTPSRIGAGIVPLTEIFTFLEKRRFTGDLSIEEASFTGFNGVQNAVDATKHLWRTS